MSPYVFHNSLKYFKEAIVSRAVMMSEHEIERLRNEAFIAAERGHQRRPQKGDWGFYAYDDGPACCGGGTGAFMWFESKQELYHYIDQYEVWFAGERDPVVARTVQKLVSDLWAANSTREQFLTDYNLLMRGVTQMVWLGAFDELLSGEHEFAVKMRAMVLDEPDRALTEEEAEELADSLMEYI